jgi:hypothetical protein
MEIFFSAKAFEIPPFSAISRVSNIKIMRKKTVLEIQNGIGESLGLCHKKNSHSLN